MKISGWHFVVAVVLGVVALLYFKTRDVVASEHERFDRSLERIRRLDSDFNQDVLKVRFHLLEDYDSFNEDLLEIGKLSEDLKSIPSFVDDSGRETISRKVTELSQLVKEKGEIVESFKSQNAVLKNSLRYFPLAGSELIKRLNAAGAHRELEISFNDLMRQVLAYSIVPTEEQEEEIRTRLAQIDDWRLSHQEDVEAGIVASLSSHAKAILNRQPKVEALVRQLTSLPIAQRAEEVTALYETQFAQAMKSVEFYRGFLYVLCITLLGGIAYALVALRTANLHLERRRLDLARNNVDLQTEIAERKQAESNLERAHAELEVRVQERTVDLAKSNEDLQKEAVERKQAQTELENVHKQLLEVSRQSGMAEIATNVLHNVGNVLNSVNISATLAMESVKKSRASGLAKAVKLIQEHESDLALFITSDPRGKLLPAYLARLSDNLKDEQESTVQELDSLRENIEHIKEIVTMQQSYANVAGIKEFVNIKDIIEESLRMNANALDRNGVELVREFDEVPMINVEKHKVLQILVNLERNAKHACEEAEHRDKRVTVRLSNGGDWVNIEVIDNGVGIPPENLTRIFHHGFTTRRDGHGFGLHSGALAAKEMGGSLTAHSDGPGTGAIFTLSLPLQLN